MFTGRLNRRRIGRNAIALSLSAALMSFSSIASAEIGPVGVDVQFMPDIIDNSYADTYAPSAGEYGGLNVGGAPQWNSGASMPSMDDATGLGSMIGERKYDGGSHTLSGDLNCEKFLLINNATVTISGDVTLRVQEEFKVQDQSRIELEPGATLTIHLHKDAAVQDFSSINPDTTRVDAVTIYRHGNLPLFVQNSSHLCGTIVSPDAYLQVENSANFYGKFTGMFVHLKNDASGHFAGPDIKPLEALYD